MREIKFRAWDGRQMWKDVACFEGEPYVMNYEETGFVPLLNEDQIASNGKPIIMQFTGLHDKNGKDIYEGDILSSQYTDYEVVFEFSRWDLKRIRGAYSYPVFNNSAKEMESIGNIHENPKLLEPDEGALIEREAGE